MFLVFGWTFAFLAALAAFALWFLVVEDNDGLAFFTTIATSAFWIFAWMAYQAFSYIPIVEQVIK